ncbi:CheY-like chemotaxis protein [Algoriphagus iocasae]|uniref:CheY-like chemotaxis protein n=1 Tax=Algoriphagus iocasae TaxID=1836499 RepID=A0A841MHV5_9BACT|nr:response regulator [Algoriphagus iocasae]MBB6327862.1 CheY-like chemotaxis protein [Algoriphagus iocasae]
MKLKSPRIYIVDDDQVVILLHKLQVKKQGLFDQTQVFFEAKKALDSIIPLDSEDQRILIFLDINMPEMNGWEFLTHLQKKIKLSDIKVVIVTSSLSKSDKEKARGFNMVIDFWEKPMVPAQLIKLKEELEDWLGGKTEG